MCIILLLLFSSPDPSTRGPRIPEELLPRCKKTNCGGLLRPHVVWFHENLDPKILKSAGIRMKRKFCSPVLLFLLIFFVFQTKSWKNAIYALWWVLQVLFILLPCMLLSWHQEVFQLQNLTWKSPQQLITLGKYFALKIPVSLFNFQLNEF